MSPAWIAAAAAVVAALAAAKPLHWLWRLLAGTHDFITDWPRMKAAIADLQNQVAEIKAETRPNGGHSMRDVVHRTAEAVDDIRHEQARLRAQIELRQPPATGRTAK